MKVHYARVAPATGIISVPTTEFSVPETAFSESIQVRLLRPAPLIPHLGHDSACSDISAPHSLHLIRGIAFPPYYTKIPISEFQHFCGNVGNSSKDLKLHTT